MTKGVNPGIDRCEMSEIHVVPHEREGRIGWGSLGEGREGEWMHAWK